MEVNTGTKVTSLGELDDLSGGIIGMAGDYV